MEVELVSRRPRALGQYLAQREQCAGLLVPLDLLS